MRRRRPRDRTCAVRPRSHTQPWRSVRSGGPHRFHVAGRGRGPRSLARATRIRCPILVRRRGRLRETGPARRREATRGVLPRLRLRTLPPRPAARRRC